jgi:hypothetical protein
VKDYKAKEILGRSSLLSDNSASIQKSYQWVMADVSLSFIRMRNNDAGEHEIQWSDLSEPSHVCVVSLVYLVHLVCLVHLVRLV